MVDFTISEADSTKPRTAWCYANDEIASVDARLRYVLRRVCIQYGWRLALAGDNAHNQIADEVVRERVFLVLAALACILSA
jgi:hypothetical protein